MQSVASSSPGETRIAVEPGFSLGHRYSLSCRSMLFARVSSSVCGPIMSRRVCIASVRLAGFKKRLLSSTRLLFRYVANLIRTGLDRFASDLPTHPVDPRDHDRGRDAHHMV